MVVAVVVVAAVAVAVVVVVERFVAGSRTERWLGVLVVGIGRPSADCTNRLVVAVVVVVEAGTGIVALAVCRIFL